MVQKTKKVYLHIYAAIKNHITREYLKKREKTHNTVSEKGGIPFFATHYPNYVTHA